MKTFTICHTIDLGLLNRTLERDAVNAQIAVVKEQMGAELGSKLVNTFGYQVTPTSYQGEVELKLSIDVLEASDRRSGYQIAAMPQPDHTASEIQQAIATMEMNAKAAIASVAAMPHLQIPPGVLVNNLKGNFMKEWAGTQYSLSTVGEKIMSKKFWETGRNFDGAEDEIAKLPTVIVPVDGDIVAYRAAASCDGRYYEVDGKRFPYKKEAVAYCDKKSIANSDIVSGYEPEPEENALHNTNVTISNIRDFYIYERKLNPTLKIFLSGATNFRYNIYPDYKKNRKGVRKPHHLTACKDHLENQYGGYRYDGYEADDLIGMTVTALQAQGSSVISIASNDKDFTQLGGQDVEQYDFTTGKVWTVSEEEGIYYFYKQILIGDKSDGIPGLPGVGPQTAIKILGPPSGDERRLYNLVVMAYQEKLEISDLEAAAMVEIRGQLLYLLRIEGKLWTPPEPKELAV